MKGEIRGYTWNSTGSRDAYSRDSLYLRFDPVSQAQILTYTYKNTVHQPPLVLFSFAIGTKFDFVARETL